MSYSVHLQQQSIETELAVFATEAKEKLSLTDLLKQISRETFNCTMPVLRVESATELERTIKLAITAKYVSAKEVVTLADLLEKAPEIYMKKLHNKLIRAAKAMGTHVPKMTSTSIEDGAVYFDLPSGVLKSGITSSTVNSGKQITGSKDGILVASFGFLSATYQVGAGPALSLFERIAANDSVVTKLLCELSQDPTFVDELVQVSNQHMQASPSNHISQFQKQNFIKLDGKTITVTPLQSVNTTVAIKQAIDKVYRDKGRVNVKRYAAGGANTQNVSSINQDLGGSIPHLKAWIPSQRRRKDVFYFLYRTKRLALSRTQKGLVATLAWSIECIENKGHSTRIDRKAIENLFSQITHLLLVDLEMYSLEINQLTDTKIVYRVQGKINEDIKAYFTADTIQNKSQASETLALQLISLTAAEMKRNKLHIPIEDNALDIATQILEKGDVLCPSL